MAYERKNYWAIYSVDPGTPSNIRKKRVKWSDVKKMDSDDEIVRLVLLQDQNPDEYDNGPPTSPDMGEMHIVGANPSDAWLGHVGEKATYVGTGSGWTFASPDDPTEVEFSGEESFSASFGQHPEETAVVRYITLPGYAKQRSFTVSGVQRGPKTLPSKLEQTAASADCFWYTFDGGDGNDYDTALTASRQTDPMDIPLS